MTLPNPIDELIEKAAAALAVEDFAGAQFSQWTDEAKEPYLRRAKAVADALALSTLQEQKRKLEEALGGWRTLCDRLAAGDEVSSTDWLAVENPTRALLSGGGDGLD